MEERLQKILSRAGIASRRAAERMILEGRVFVNGQIVKELGQCFDVKKCCISVDGKKISQQEKSVYYLLYKPKGYLSTAKDERGRKTVLQLLPEVKERIYPVGRLDSATEGLLLLTNDGEFTNGLLHPSRQVEKKYVVRLSHLPTEEELDRLRNGVDLDDGRTAPAKVWVLPTLGKSLVEISIHEGRNRQVRRMFAAIGYDVKALKRISFAGLSLDGLRRGEYRALTTQEVRRLKNIAGIAEACAP